MIRHFLLLVAALVAVGCCCADATAAPLHGFYNGALEQQNIIECSNTSGELVAGTLTLHNSDGSVLEERRFSLTQHATSHQLLDPVLLRGGYGTYTVRTLQGSESDLRCQTVFYRHAPAGAGEVLDYAYALPTDKFIAGPSGGTFNSMHPDPAAPPVYNWLTIYNPATTTLEADVAVYGASGSAASKRTIGRVRIGPRQRRDFALGHEEGKQVGTYAIVPRDSNARYSAYTIRYGTSPHGNRFDFAFPLAAQAGTCDSGLVPANTMDPATNWAEIATVSKSPVEIQFEVFRSDGSLVHRETATLAPRGQLHRYLNQYLGSRAAGSFRVRCVNPGATPHELLVQSLFYGHPAEQTPALEWAYAYQGATEQAQSTCGYGAHVNTFFDAGNWLLIANEAQ
ncbi:MAG: hypothetical protein KDD69_15045, partial [Bdellovibrionales bacterium]|nr:hypothetical protein [Bdellovibrionales bacterium]